MNLKLAALAAGMALVLSSSAHAQSWFQFEAGIGGTAYEKGGDGLWYQDAFQHKLELTAPAVKFGITGDLLTRPRWGVAWHADYVWLGTVHTQALATPSDANYNIHTKSCVGPCWPLANYLGSGHDAGFALTVEPYYDIGPWRVGLEIGPYIHRYSWAVDVMNWRPSADAPPSNIHVDNKPRWVLGATAGLSASYRNFSIEYQYFYNPAPHGENVPPIWHGAHVLMAKYRF